MRSPFLLAVAVALARAEDGHRALEDGHRDGPRALQDEGNQVVNWLLEDIDIYLSAQPLDELREKLVDFKTEFSDEEATVDVQCGNKVMMRFPTVVDNAIRYGFWGNSTIREKYGEPMQLYEIVAYSGQPVSGIPLYETSYEQVTAIDYNETYLNLVFRTTHASLVDGFYQWTLEMETSDGACSRLRLYHRKVARANPNIARIMAKFVPTLDDNADTLTEFLGNNNDASTQAMVENVHKILKGESPCSVSQCWWQDLGPGPGPPTP